MSSLNQVLKKILKTLDKGSRLFVIYEGEQVVPQEAETARKDLCVVIEGQWRPEDAPLPPGVEVIPGYQRPVNWKPLQARNATLPGEIEVGGRTWKESQ